MPVYREETLHPVVDLDAPADWRLLAEACQGWLSPGDTERLGEYLGSAAKSCAVERRYVDKDYRDTFSNFYSKKFAAYPPYCMRLHFFNRSLGNVDLLSVPEEELRASYLGYVVARPTRIRTIGRTVLDPKRLGFVKGWLATTEYESNLLGVRLATTGFPFISQDTDVTVCAHAACWMVFRYFSERYPAYAETHPFELTQLTEDYSFGRLVPSPGLTVSQVAEIFSRFGFYPVVYFRELLAADNGLFDRLLYYYVESGLPVVAGLTNKLHAVTVIGHAPPASPANAKSGKALNTADLVEGFIINDDGALPYQFLWKNGPTGAHRNESGYRIEDIDAFVVPVYEKIHLAAEYVEGLARALLADEKLLDPAALGFAAGDLVYRIFLTSSRSFKRFRTERAIPNGIGELYRQIPLPKFVWVCEITTKNLYARREVLGEIVWDATASQYDDFSFIVLHLPGRVIVNDRDSSKLDESGFLLNEALQAADPYAMYVNNLKECT